MSRAQLGEYLGEANIGLLQCGIPGSEAGAIADLRRIFPK
jgi:hypothetical protein